MRRRLRAQRALAAALLALAAATVAFAVTRTGARPSPPPARDSAGSHPQPRARSPSRAADRGGHAPVRGSAARRMRIPILMYHVVSRPPPGTPNPQLWVSQERFAGQMRALRRAGYRAVTLRQAFAGWVRGSRPARSVPSSSRSTTAT